MPQEVILLTDVPGLGQVGDSKTVKDGYARNYLIPQELAVPANANIKKRFERQKSKLEQARVDQLAQAKAQAERVSKVGLVFERTVGQGGRLFGAVTPLDIAQEIGKQGATVEKKSILMSGPIKTVGTHQIRVRIHSQVIVDVPVNVIPLETKKGSEHAEHAEQALEEATPFAEADDDY